MPELVPIRYGRMLVSPFAYFRGAALPMASDLADTPCTGLVVQACGDAHLSNFGIFASPERKFLFDVNDFDETLPGPWEWDVKRLAASLEVAGRGNGFSRKQRRRIVAASTRMYRETMRTFAGMSNIDVWYARVDLDLVEKMFSPGWPRRTASFWPGTWPRPGPGTACRRSASWPAWWTGRPGSSPTRRSSCRCLICARRSATSWASRRNWTRCWPGTAAR